MKRLTHTAAGLQTGLKTSASALALAALLSACQTTPPVNPDLERARQIISEARANPYAAKAAAVELQRAQQTLVRAEQAWSADRNTDETRHLAFLAQRSAEVAQAQGMQAQSEERLQQAGAERERVRLQARTLEADRATSAARQAQAQAQSAQAQAQTAQGQAAQSQRQAEAAQRDAAASRLVADSAREQAGSEAERAASLERDLQALRGKNTERGMVVTLGDVLFTTGRAELQPGAMRTVQQLAQVLQQYPERRVLIEGFTDNTGSDQLNMDLSQRRAESFRQALIGAGVNPDRMELRAQGSANPVADNSTAAGRQMNRRVEVLFSNTQGRFAMAR